MACEGEVRVRDIHRAKPFDPSRTMNVTKGNDFSLRCRVKYRTYNSDGTVTLTDIDASSDTLSDPVLTIKPKPEGNATWESVSAVATISGADITVSLPYITVEVKATDTSINWTTQVMRGTYWAKLDATINGKKVTLLAIPIYVTD